MLEHNVAKQEIKFVIEPLTKKYIKFCKKNKVAITKKGWIKFLGIHRATLNDWRKCGGELKKNVEESIALIDVEDRKTKKELAARKQGYKVNAKGRLTKTGFTKEEVSENVEKRIAYYNEVRKRINSGEYDLTNERNIEKAVDDFFANIISQVDTGKTDEFDEKIFEEVAEIPTLPLLALHLGMSTNQLKRYSPEAPGGKIVAYAKMVIEAESMQSLVNAKGSYVGIMFAMKNGFDYIDKVNQQITNDKTDIQKLSTADLENEIKRLENETEDFIEFEDNNGID